MKKIEREPEDVLERASTRLYTASRIDSMLPYTQTCKYCGGKFVIESRNDLFYWKGIRSIILRVDCPHCFREIAWDRWGLFSDKSIWSVVRGRGTTYGIFGRPFVILWRRVVG